MKKTLSLLLVLALLALGATAFAAGSDYSGWVGIGVNYNFQKAQNDTIAVGGGVTESLSYNPSVGFGVEAGYKITPNLGVRARYDYYSATGSNTFNNVPAGVGFNAGSVGGNAMDYYAQVMGFMPVSANAECYLGVGVGGLSESLSIGASSAGPVGGTYTEVIPAINATNTAVGIPISVGGNYFFTDQIAANVDLTYMISTNTDNIASYFAPLAGIKYTF